MLKNILFNSNIKFSLFLQTRNFSIENSKLAKDHYKLLIVGGGTGGISTGAKFAKKLGPQNVAIVDPSKYHCWFN